MAVKGRFQVVVGAVGTIGANGKAVYHKLGDLVDLSDDEAERLVGLGAVLDTKSTGGPVDLGSGSGAAEQGLPLGGGEPSPPTGDAAEQVK